MPTQDELQLKANEIYDPVTGEIVVAEELSADELIELYSKLRHLNEEISTSLWQLRQEAGRRTKDQAKGKTTRLAGRSRQAKVTFPSHGWNDSILREAWHSFPDLRDNFLKIKSVSVIAKEFAKLESMAIEDNKPLETFRSMLVAAVTSPTTPPSITVEK